MNIKESFERIGFTPEEKMDLTARLERAAEQEDNMTNATKRKIKKISTGMIFGIAAAVMMTAGALAATLSPGVVRTWLHVSTPGASSSVCQPDQSADTGALPKKPALPLKAVPSATPAEEPAEEPQEPVKPSGELRTWFNTSAAAAPEALENNTCGLKRSETYNGWTVTLDECTGDHSSVYIHVTLTAPEGVVLDESCFYGIYGFVQDGCLIGGRHMYHLPDEDPTDNRIAFVIENDFNYGSLKGETIRVEISELLNYWWEKENAELSKEEEAFYAQLTELTAPIRDHVWVFEDVTLDFPAQTVQLESGAQVPYLDGTTTVTRLEASPFNVTVRVEGGSIAALADYNKLTTEKDPAIWKDPQTLTVNGVAVIGGVPEQDGKEQALDRWEMVEALTVEVVLRDGTVLPLTSLSGERLGRNEGIEGPDTPFAELALRCAELSNYPSQIWDPAQVDHVTVCGVEIPVIPVPAED